jgi:hypothetical protein
MRRYWAVCAAVLLAGAGGVRVSAQVQYARGQNVAPVFEGWEHNPDGTYSMVFGYLNRNFEEEVDIPLGPGNTITLGGETFGDRGQPTHFYPRRQRFLFRVVVPKDWDKQQKVVWTLTSRGRTDQAKGWLQPEWELSEDVIVENMEGGVPDPDNKPPAITVAPVQPVTLPNAATLTAAATDDGLPKPYRRNASNAARAAEPRRPMGVSIKWIQYRGPGKVTFDPPISPVVHGQPVTLTSKASFSAPGTYVLRAIAFDGQLFTNSDVTVIVNGNASAQAQR